MSMSASHLERSIGVSTADDGGIVVPAGAIAAIGVAAALTSVRSQVGQTNAALVLVVVIVAAAALGGRIAGIVTALSAAVAFNFFFTQPYLTLRINDRQDLVRMVLLFLVGLVVGELTLLRDRRVRTHVTGQTNSRHVHRMAQLVRDGAPVNDLWKVTHDGIVDALGATSCRFERADQAGAGKVDLATSVVAGSAAVYANGGFQFPADGAQLAVQRAGRGLGRIVVAAAPHRALTAEDRVTAVTLADLFAVGLADADVPAELA